jgi:alkylation response protein AidB-like acyl-CoA dehydrogenase
VGGIGAPGITPAPGVGAAGTTGQQRDAVAESMTGMPNTGTGEAAAGSLLVPAAFLLGALGAGWMAIQSRLIAGAVRSAELPGPLAARSLRK